MLTLAHMAASIECLLEGQEPWRCPAPPARQPEQDDIASRVGAIGYRVLWNVVPSRGGPRLDPRCRAAFQFCNDALRNFRIEITLHNTASAPISAAVPAALLPRRARGVVWGR